MNHLAFSPDGKRLATASLDGTCKVWDTDTWQEVKSLPANGKTFTAVVWRRDGKLLAAGSCVLDGELVGDVYHCFDLLARDGADCRPLPYLSRFAQAVDLVDPCPADGLRFAETATTARAKRDLIDRLRRADAEGVVFKYRASPYQPGRPASGGSQLKLKFYATKFQNAYALDADSVTKLFSDSTSGLGKVIDKSINNLVDPTSGAIARENATLKTQTQSFQDQIKHLDTMLADKRNRLLAQFANMESVLAGLQSQQSALSSLSGLSSASSSSKSSSK